MTAAEFDAWIIEHRWSNVRLADRLEVSKTTINRWRTGKYPIPRMVELALAALEVEGSEW